MSYDLIETSDALGEPFELYRFSYGGGAANKFTYTDADFAIEVATDRFEPIPIERNTVIASQTLDKSTLEVEVPQDSGIAEVFLNQPPAAVVALTIFRAHFDGDTGTITTPQTVWAGRVMGAAREGHMASLSCEPVLTSLRRVGLRRHYQYMCPHVLYGSQCKANAGLHLTRMTVSAVDPRSFTISGDIGVEYLGGIVAWQPLGQPVERRTILRRFFDAGIQATQFIVSGGTRDLAVGDEVEMYLGCRHILDDCRDRFANSENFGGMPFIPGQNPHGTTAIYN